MQLDYKTAKELFESRCPNHTKFPYEAFHLCGEDEVFLLVDIPLKDLHFNTAVWDSKQCSRTARVKILKLQNIPNHDPIWVFFMKFNGQRWIPKQSGKVNIADGVHRTTAKIWRGDVTTNAYFPQTHYDVYKLHTT